MDNKRDMLGLLWWQWQRRPGELPAGGKGPGLGTQSAQGATVRLFAEVRGATPHPLAGYGIQQMTRLWVRLSGDGSIKRGTKSVKFGD